MKDKTLEYFGEQYSVHEYIKLNIIANRGTQSAMYKEKLLILAQERNLSITEKETKEQLFDLLSTYGISDLEWEKLGSIGVTSGHYQKEFGISHADVKRFEKFNLLIVVGSYEVRNFGKYLKVPLYSISQFLQMDQEMINQLLKEYPKGKKRNDLHQKNGKILQRR